MGCDGGTIPKRKEIVKNKERRTKPERDRGASAAEKWKNCAICDWILRKPIVAGHWGHIFSKECVLQHLIDYKQRATLMSYDLVAEKSPILDSLHSMKDVKEIKLKENPTTHDSQASSIEDEVIRADFICPITGLETNGKYKFVFSWNCGCVVSERAIKEVPNDDKCLVCQTPYKPFDLVVLNPDKKDLHENQCKFLARKMNEQLKKGKSESGGDSSQSPGTSRGESSTLKSSSSRHAELRRRRQESRTHASLGTGTEPSKSGAPPTTHSRQHDRHRRGDNHGSSPPVSKKQRS